MKVIFLLLVVVPYFVAANEEFKCYSCNSIIDSACGDPFDPKGSNIRQVATSKKMCFKVVSKEKGEVKNIQRTVGNTGTPDLRSDQPIATLEMYNCSSHLCNGTSSVTAAVSSFMMLAILLAWSNL